MRKITNEFMKELKEGKFKVLIEEIKKDNTLDTELRGDKVIVYYRGGKLLTIYHDKETIEVNNSYKTNCEDKTEIIGIEECLNRIPLVKYDMDKYLSEKMNLEKEFQQLIVRENNYSKISDSTDYYIADMEYNEKTSEGRFDLIGFKWESKGSARKNPKNVKLVLFEIKYGKDAIKSVGNNPGLKTHLEDFDKTISDEKIFCGLADDISEVVKQKAELGLIKGNKGIDGKYNFSGITISHEKPEVVFILINYDYESTMLKEELNNITKNYDFPIYFAQSSYMGYGLYFDKFIKFDDMKAKLNNQ
ncbi:MAG: hypothetical protein IKQ61_13615 [Spirochaetales bacterium]|nr:hypothetical protein [Spirochaetales bacterium]